MTGMARWNKAMPIKTNCPSCDAPYNVADQMAGKNVKCTSCGVAFVVQSREKDELAAPDHEPLGEASVPEKRAKWKASNRHFWLAFFPCWGIHTLIVAGEFQAAPLGDMFLNAVEALPTMLVLSWLFMFPFRLFVGNWKAAYIGGLLLSVAFRVAFHIFVPPMYG